MYFVHTNPAHTPFLSGDMRSVCECVSAFGTHLHIPQDTKLPFGAWSVLDIKPAPSSFSSSSSSSSSANVKTEAWMLLHRDGKQRVICTVKTSVTGEHAMCFANGDDMPFKIKQYKQHQRVSPLVVCYSTRLFPFDLPPPRTASVTSALPPAPSSPAKVYKEAEEEEKPPAARAWRVWLFRPISAAQKKKHAYKYPFSLHKATSEESAVEQTVYLFFTARFPDTVWLLNEQEHAVEYTSKSDATKGALELYPHPSAPAMSYKNFRERVASSTLKPFLL